MINPQALVKELAAQVRAGALANEVIDSYINTATFEEHTAILDALGDDCDFSEPPPDLSVGWSGVRAQLAYSALAWHVGRAVGATNPEYEFGTSMSTRCDECDESIPDDEPSNVNASHDASCSLHDAGKARP